MRNPLAEYRTRRIVLGKKWTANLRWNTQRIETGICLSLKVHRPQGGKRYVTAKLELGPFRALVFRV